MKFTRSTFYRLLAAAALTASGAATAAGIPVTICKAGGTPVNAASMLGVLGLGAQGGEEIVLASDAEGADAALDRLAKLVAEGLEELPETV